MRGMRQLTHFATPDCADISLNGFDPGLSISLPLRLFPPPQWRTSACSRLLSVSRIHFAGIKIPPSGAKHHRKPGDTYSAFNGLPRVFSDRTLCTASCERSPSIATQFQCCRQSGIFRARQPPAPARVRHWNSPVCSCTGRASHGPSELLIRSLTASSQPQPAPASCVSFAPSRFASERRAIPCAGLFHGYSLYMPRL